MTRRQMMDPRIRGRNSVFCHLSSVLRLLNHVRQQPKKAGALDCAGKLALLERRYCGDAARHDLATLGDVALQQPHVFVVDLRRIGAGERTCLAPAKEWASCPAAPAAEFAAAVSTFEAHGVNAPSRRYLHR